MMSLARLMEARSTPLVLSPTALRAVLDGIAVRLDEVREIAKALGVKERTVYNYLTAA